MPNKTTFNFGSNHYMIFTTAGKHTKSLDVFHNWCGCKPATPKACILSCGITSFAYLSVSRQAFITWDKQIWSSVSETDRLMKEQRGETCIVYCMLYAVYCILYAVCCILYTVYCILYAVCCILYTVCCILYAVYCILYTVYCMLYTVCCMLQGHEATKCWTSGAGHIVFFSFTYCTQVPVNKAIKWKWE